MNIVDVPLGSPELSKNFTFLRRFLTILLPIVLILAAAIWTFYANQASNALALQKATEREAIRLSIQTNLIEFENVRSDLLYLADQYKLLNPEARPPPPAYAPLAARYLAFACARRTTTRSGFWMGMDTRSFASTRTMAIPKTSCQISCRTNPTATMFAKRSLWHVEKSTSHRSTSISSTGRSSAPSSL